MILAIAIAKIAESDRSTTGPRLIELPITTQMAEVLSGRRTAREAVGELMLRPQRAEPEPVHEAGLRGRVEPRKRLAQRAQVRAVEPVAVDHVGRDDTDDDPGRTAGDGAKELLPTLVGDLLRVVQERERADGVVAQPLVVEEDTGGDERPGEAPTPRLVRAGDEPDAEPPVEREELLAAAAHPGHDSAAARRNPTRVRFVEHL